MNPLEKQLHLLFSWADSCDQKKRLLCDQRNSEIINSTELVNAFSDSLNHNHSIPASFFAALENTVKTVLGTRDMVEHLRSPDQWPLFCAIHAVLVLRSHTSGDPYLMHGAIWNPAQNPIAKVSGQIYTYLKENLLALCHKTIFIVNFSSTDIASSVASFVDAQMDEMSLFDGTNTTQLSSHLFIQILVYQMIYLIQKHITEHNQINQNHPIGLDDVFPQDPHNDSVIQRYRNGHICSYLFRLIYLRQAPQQHTTITNELMYGKQSSLFEKLLCSPLGHAILHETNYIDSITKFREYQRTAKSPSLVEQYYGIKTDDSKIAWANQSTESIRDLQKRIQGKSGHSFRWSRWLRRWYSIIGNYHLRWVILTILFFSVAILLLLVLYYPVYRWDSLKLS